MFYREEKLDDLPFIINLEVFRGACPCKCVHCPVGIMQNDERGQVYGIKHMNIELFKKVCNELYSKGIGVIRIHSVGEPLLWNNLVEAIRYAREKGILTWIFTSLVTDNYKLLEELCNRVSVIEVSINSVEKKDYLNTKGIDAFELVKKNLEYMNHYIRENNLKTRLIVSRVQSDNRLKDEEFIRFWKGTGFVQDAFVRSYHTYNNLLNNIENNDMHKEPCIVHWKRFNISVDGLAVVCFNELFKKEVPDECILGNICNENIYDIWHGKKMKLIRAADINNNYDEINFSGNFPCKNCLNCQGTKGRVTSEYQITQLNLH